MIASALLLLAMQAEGAAYDVDYLAPPDGARLEVGGLDFLPDGRLVVSTRRGQVWIVENAMAKDPADARFTLFAEGLWEGLGLRVVNGEIFVLQRGELSKLADVDGDGTCDDIETVTYDWGLSGNYHEFAYGLPVDKYGNFYISLNVSFFSPKWWHGKSTAPYRGWALRIAPDGTVSPVAAGFRSPCGISLDPEDRLFITDNQGDWMAASPIFHVVPDGFYGHPASLDWTDEYRSTQTLSSDTVPPAAASNRRPAAIWLPYKWSRSPGNMAWDQTDGAFGPFDGQFFLAELTNGMILRGDFEEVQGDLQGWCIPFQKRIGSAVRVTFAPDGTLFCGLTNRGWGGVPPADGIARVRWTGVEPFEIQDVSLVDGGFQIDFTKAATLGDPHATDSFRLIQYDYDYWWEYGSPERETTVLDITKVELSEDGKRMTVLADGLQPARVARLGLFGLQATDGSSLAHEEFSYTVNQLRSGPRTDQHVARIAPIPPARESGDEGWLRLTYGDATDRWDFQGWELVDAEPDPEDPTRFKVVEGVNALTNTASTEPSDYVSKHVFGDAKVHVEFMLPEQGSSGVLLMGRYGLRFADGPDDGELSLLDCGAIEAGATFSGQAPLLFAYRGAGTWHKVDIDFRAPRFDEAGNKTANASIVRVMMDGVLLHENVELPEPTTGALDLGPEAAEGPLVLVGSDGPVAFGNIRVFPVHEGEAEVEEGWVPLMDFEAEDPLADWKISEGGTWYVEDDTLIGEGTRSHVFSPRDDYEDFEVRAKIKVNDGGNSGLYFRVTFQEEGWPKGYEAQINSTMSDPQKTGTLYNFSPIKTQLIAADTWFDYHVQCREEDEGTRVVIRVNGVVVNDYLDPERTHSQGHIAFQQHHDGSVIEVKELEVREF